MHALTVSDESLLSVGQFAKLAGLSVHTLRHYDAVGLLPPADVDDRTGYRRYSRDQLTTVRVITDLRWLAVPIQQVREIIADEGSTRARELLRAHADRLMRERVHLDKQIAQCTQYADEGVPMPTITSATTPVQMKIGVTDVGRAREFYASAFGLAESVIRHTDEFDVTGFQFGTYGQPGFFLMLLVDSEAFDQPGRSTFGFSVADLGETHQRALDAGAVEAVAINDPQGMPRNSAVTDPDGNWIWLYQG